MKSLLKILASVLIGGFVFVLFVPGVLVTLPPGKPSTSVEVLAVHGTLFALLNHVVVRVAHGVINAL